MIIDMRGFNMSGLIEKNIMRLVFRNFFWWMDDEQYLKFLYRIVYGERLDLKNPILYNEKLQWLKLYDRNPVYTEMVDKYKAKDFVRKKAGEEYVVPLLGVWDSGEEICFDQLPDRFVLKTTHDSGSIVICDDKNKFNKEKAIKTLNKSLKRNYYQFFREWPYKNVHPRIIAEPMLVDDAENESSGCLTDYKVFCFNGEPKLMYIGKDDSKTPTTDFFDMNFTHLDIRMKDPNAVQTPDKPKYFDEMVEVSKKLASGIPHVRVDFYCANHQLFVGEMTFYHNGGFGNITPDCWKKILGDWIKLPKKKTYEKN